MITRTRTCGLTGVALLLAFCAGSAFAQGQGGPPVNIREGKFEAPGERRADRAFRMEQGFRGKEHAQQQAAKLFERAANKQQVALEDDKAGGLIHISKDDPSAHYRVNATTGDFSFHRGMKDYLNGDATRGLPAGDAAVRKAKEHLQALGELPDEKELVVQHIGGLRMSEMGENGEARVVDKLVTVHFGRVIDGVPVSGPGSKIVVDLGADGQLVGVSKRWMALKEEKVPPANLRSKAEVEQAARGKLQREWALAKRINAQPPALGYYDDGNGNIEPAYFVVAELVHDIADEQGVNVEVQGEYLNVVPAMKNSRGKFEQEEAPGRQPQQEGAPQAAPDQQGGNQPPGRGRP